MSFEVKKHNKTSFFLAIFNDIVTLKNAATELKNFNIKLRSISIGKPKLTELEKIPLPQGKVYAFFMFDTLNNKLEASYQAIVKKYHGMALDNKIILTT